MKGRRRLTRDFGPRGAVGGWLLAGGLALLLPIAVSASPPGDRRTHLPDHRLGPLQIGRTTEKQAVERLGKGLRFPTARGVGRCWSEESLMLCTAFEKGALTAISFEENGALPPAAERVAHGPGGTTPPRSRGAWRATLRPKLFLSSLATETGLRINTSERELLATLGSPHELRGLRAPFNFIYRSRKATDPACPGECTAVYALSKERITSIQITTQ